MKTSTLTAAVVALATSAVPALAMDPHTTREIVVGEGMRGVLLVCAMVVPFLVVFVGMEGRLSGKLTPAAHLTLAFVSLAYAGAAVWFARDDVPSMLGAAAFVVAGILILGLMASRCDPWFRAPRSPRPARRLSRRCRKRDALATRWE